MYKSQTAFVVKRHLNTICHPKHMTTEKAPPSLTLEKEGRKKWPAEPKKCIYSMTIHL